MTVNVSQTVDTDGAAPVPEYIWLVLENADHEAIGITEGGHADLKSCDWKKGASVSYKFEVGKVSRSQRIWVGLETTPEGERSRVANCIEIEEK